VSGEVVLLLFVPSAGAAALVVLADTLPYLHLRHRFSVTLRGLGLLLLRILSEIGFAWLGVLLVRESLLGLGEVQQALGAAVTGLATSSILRSHGIEIAGRQVGAGPIYERWTGLIDRHLNDISAESQSRQAWRLTTQFLKYDVSLEDNLFHRLVNHIQYNGSLSQSEKWERAETIKDTLKDAQSSQEEKTRTLVGQALRWDMHRTLREVMVESRGRFWTRTFNWVSRKR
jgi:hypothetical protein